MDDSTPFDGHGFDYDPRHQAHRTPLVSPSSLATDLGTFTEYQTSIIPQFVPHHRVPELEHPPH